MDLRAFDGLPFPAMPANLRVTAILAKYADLRRDPTRYPADRLRCADSDDADSVAAGNRPQLHPPLAEAAGCVFYVDPGPVPGTNTAYWGPN